MSWDKYAICTKCGYYRISLGDHANAFQEVCPKCGEQNWDTKVIAQEIFTGKWWNPLTWFDSKLVKKLTPQGKEVV